MLEWHGDEILKKIGAQTVVAMTAVMASSIRTAKAQHPPNVRTATYQGSIQLRPVIMRGDQLVGFWGSFNVNYAIYLEMGTIFMPEYRPLRNAADQHYPELAHKLRGII